MEPARQRHPPLKNALPLLKNDAALKAAALGRYALALWTAACAPDLCRSNAVKDGVVLSRHAAPPAPDLCRSNAVDGVVLSAHAEPRAEPRAEPQAEPRAEPQADDGSRAVVAHACRQLLRAPLGVVRDSTDPPTRQSPRAIRTGGPRPRSPRLLPASPMAAPPMEDAACEATGEPPDASREAAYEATGEPPDAAREAACEAATQCDRDI